MEFNPKVSIVIPVYNGSNYLRKAIDSALAQTYKNIEVIVVNDGSNDGGKTEEIAKSYGDKIRYFYKDNGGVASALNLGIREMTGEYFSWLSHDDLYYPDKVAMQVDYLHRGDRHVIIYSDYEFIDARSRFVRKKTVGNIPPERMRLELIVSDPVHGCTVLVPKRCFERMGLFNESLCTTQDYEMWFRLAKSYNFIHVPKILVKSRVHPEQGIKTITRHFFECTELFTGFLRELSIEEIDKITDDPYALFYTKVAIRIKLRGYTDAAEFALQLSRKYLDNESIPYLLNLKRIILLFIYKLLNKKFKPKYWVNKLRTILNSAGK